MDKIVLDLGFKRNSNQNEFAFEKWLDYTSGIIEKYTEDKPGLIFYQTKKGTMNYGKKLVIDHQIGKLPFMKIDSSTLKISGEVSILLNNKNLSSFVKYDIVFYNVVLSLNDR